jgi:N-acetylmuramoyl-L-alanine amidase
MSDPGHHPHQGRRAWLKQASAGVAVLVLGPHELAWGAQLMAVRVWPASDYTRVTLESDTPLNATFFSVPNPNRLVIDIEGLEISPRLKELVSKVQADDPYIAGVRMGQNKPRVVRLVIDLKQAIKPQVFGLPPVAAYQHRLVFDLYPTHPQPATTAAARVNAPAASAPGATPAAPAASQGSALGGAPLTSVGKADATPSVANGQTAAGALPTPGAAGNAQVAGPLAGGPGPGANVAQNAGNANSAPTSSQAADAMNDALGDFIGGLRKGAPGTPGSTGVKAADRALAKGGADNKADKPDKDLKEVKDTPRQSDERERLANLATRRLVIVALDPGHGGEDPGAIGPSGLYEKDVVLQVAHKLRALINEQPGMRAMLTRDADFFVPLHERVIKARRVQADLFVSIHADAFMNAEARGASVFALSEKGATSAAARWMARKENASDLVGGVNFKANDKMVMSALLDMSTTAQIKDSLKLGSAVLGTLGKVGRLHKARVEQASFAVLKAPDIPSILVETGFISNPEEESKLKDGDYQGDLASALLQGIQRYFAKNPPLARDRAL